MHAELSNRSPRLSKHTPGFRLLSSLRLCLCVCAIVFAANSTQLSGQGLGDWTEFHRTLEGAS